MNWNQPYTLAVVGIELEFAFSSSACQSIPHARQVFHAAGFDWIDYRRDGTIQVDIECVFPPLPDCQWLRQQLSAFMDVAVSLGLKYKKNLIQEDGKKFLIRILRICTQATVGGCQALK